MPSVAVGDEPLKVLVVGAGIGGLAAAIALRQAGHHIEVFESSRFASEVGAAIHLPPNVNGILRRLGLDPEHHGANNTEWVTVFGTNGEVISQKPVSGLEKIYGQPWQLIHRVDLHEALKSLATSGKGPGKPVKIHLQSKVVSCNPSTPSITLASGQSIEGDLVIGADGVHSVLRPLVSGDEMPTFPSGGSAFRFLVPISRIKADKDTAHFVERAGELQIWEGTYRRLVIYPCRDNTELNFVCLHPDSESENSVEGWNNTASVDHVLRVFHEFYAPMRKLLSMADADTIKLWRLYDRHALPTWISGYTALLGDAAHPFLPHQGQGGAQAIEDGAALGALFPLGTSKSDIPERLKLYMDARFQRATMVQDFSRQMAFKTSKNDQVGGLSIDPLEFSKVNFGHDAYAHAQALLEARHRSDWRT